MSRPNIVIVSHVGTARQEGNDRAYTHPRKRRPFVHDDGECSLCHIRRERVNGICLVCRANGAGDDVPATSVTG
jgi:hypothetical protein